ncbi:MAG: hypothetical protein A2075_18085 [Geobacteraceae bacterium GWC2_58_44]|nr:MAG: hypothetical protein A2075_18085 [Geobacteraceae bacterium GWC2_58_44]
MNCEYCGRTLRPGDTVHGIKHGSLAGSGFVPAKDSAVTVVCGPCGEKVYRLVYASLDNGKLGYPVLFKMYEELKASMRNGYKLIQVIAKLPSTDQVAIQHLIDTCKQAN